MADGAGGQTEWFTVFDDEVISRAGTAETSSPPTFPREKLQLVAVLSLHVKGLSLQQERSMLFVDRTVKYKHVHLPWKKL